MDRYQSEVVAGADVVLLGARFEGLMVVVVVVASAGVAALMADAR